MKKQVQIDISELIFEIKNTNSRRALYFIQSETEPGALMDLLSKATLESFKICQEDSGHDQTTKSLFAQKNNQIITSPEIIKKRILKLKSTQDTKGSAITIFLAANSFWHENDPQPNQVDELVNTIGLQELPRLLEATSNFTGRKAQIICQIIRQETDKKSVTITDVLKIINTTSLISEKDLFLIGKNLKYILAQEELFFLLPKLLMSDKEAFFVMWNKTNKLFPIYFWTVFWANFFTKLFVFKSNPDVYYLTSCQWLKSIANISSTKGFVRISTTQASMFVGAIFSIDWSVKNSSHVRSLDQIFLSIWQ